MSEPMVEILIVVGTIAVICMAFVAFVNWILDGKD